VRYVQLVQKLVPAGPRGEKLAWAAAVRALLSPYEDEQLSGLRQATAEFVTALEPTQDNAVPLRVLTAGLRVLLGERGPAPLTKAAFHGEVRELRRLIAASPRAFWSRMAGLDLRLIDLLRGANHAPDREREVAQLEMEYKDVEGRLAPDASTAFRSSMRRHLLWTVDRLVRHRGAAAVPEALPDGLEAPLSTPADGAGTPTVPGRDPLEQMLRGVDEYSIEQRSLDYTRSGRLSKSRS
jgi:hypothetical protein